MTEGPTTDPLQAGPPPLVVAVVDDGWRALARVSGEADLAASGPFRDAIVPYLGAGQRLVLDLSGVTFLDASCLGILENARSTLSADGGSLVLRNPSRATRRRLSVSGMDGLFDTEIG